ncbi:MAG: hypothetical protein VYC64_09755 [Candidatus Latescibacterota bacterium]|nr:hypothetical protein [Candidatus Latescibacterota bacterium]
MLESALHILLGASATVAYLTVWNRILLSTAAERAAGAPDIERKLRQRRRLAQMLLFLFLTPYLLAVFGLMDWVSAAISGSAAVPDAP